MATESAQRTRNYAFIVYPESLPDGWVDILEGLHIPAAISPLHDRDVWRESDREVIEGNRTAGEPKKAHYHVMLYFDGVKAKKAVLEMLEPLGVTFIEPVNCTAAYNRYLCHLDNPEKAHYPVEGITRLSGAVCDVSPSAPTRMESDRIRDEIIAFIRESGITELYELVDYAADNGKLDWLWFCEHKTIYINGYLKSRRHGMAKNPK